MGKADDAENWARDHVAKLPHVNGRPVATVDLGGEQFPFIISAIAEDSDRVLWQAVVEGPGAIEVPGFAPRKIKMLIVWPTGVWQLTDSHGDLTEGLVDPPA